MHQFTNGLPLAKSVSSTDYIGTDTESSLTKSSLISGVVNGILGEIDRFSSWYMDKCENLKVVNCGGNSGRFESKVKAPIFAAPNLVLVGLNSILRHNEDSE